MKKSKDKDLIILRGIPGAGKSSVALLFGTEHICTADDYFMVDGEYKFNPAKLGEAHKACQMKCANLMETKVDKIIIANTNTVHHEMIVYEELAKLNNYKIYHLIIENRHGNKNVHGVPDEVINKMIDRFQIKL